MKKPQKTHFITNLSIISILLALYSIFDNFSTLSMQNRPEFQAIKRFMPAAFVSPQVMAFEITVAVAVVIASIGLYRRLNWARMMYIVMLAIVTLWEIYASISSYLELSEYVQEFSFGGSIYFVVIGSIIGVGIGAFLIWKLSSEAIKSEFGIPEDMEVTDLDDLRNLPK